MQQTITFKNPNVVVNGPLYTGKPLAYLDHNIISVLAGKGENDIICKLREEYQVVYSKENLAEIKRSDKEYRQKQLEVFRNLNARELKLDISDNGKAIILDKIVTVYDSYKKYCNDEDNMSPLYKILFRFNLKLFGGCKEYSFKTIKKDYLRVHAEEVKKNHIPSNSNLANIEKMFLELEGIDRKEWKDVMHVMSSGSGISAKQLGNIIPPNVLKKIWCIFSKRKPHSDYNWSSDQFYGIDKNPTNPDIKLHLFQKVEIIYNRLNSIGYFSDTDISEEGGFTRTFSDMGHASMASFANALFSNDQRFIKKSRAAYEYLDIEKKINPFTIA